MMSVDTIGWNWLKIMFHIDRVGVLRGLLLFPFDWLLLYWYTFNSVYYKNGGKGRIWFWELSELGFCIKPYSPVEERLKNKHAVEKFGITVIIAILECVFPIFNGFTLSQSVW